MSPCAISTSMTPAAKLRVRQSAMPPRETVSPDVSIRAERGGVVEFRDINYKRGLNEKETADLIADANRALAESLTEKLQVLAEEVARQKGVPLSPLRAILAKLGDAHIPDHEIPLRLSAAADELIKLRAQLARLRDGRPEL